MTKEIERIHEKIKELSFERQITYCLLCCERLLPNYKFFCEEFKDGNYDVLTEGINYINNFLLSDNKKNDGILELIEKIDLIAPKPEDYETILASSALDACGAVIETLYFRSGYN